MNQHTALFLPILAQVFLTCILYIALGVAKARAVKAGLVDLERRALHDDAWPESVVKINNSIRNQFEVPVLFYVVSLVLWHVGSTGLFIQSMAWLFVISRVVHAFIHTGSNVVSVRRTVFTFGCLVVFAMLGAAVLGVVT